MNTFCLYGEIIDVIKDNNVFGMGRNGGTGRGVRVQIISRRRNVWRDFKVFVNQIV